MHNYLETYLLGRENLSFFEDSEQYKLMAKEIIEKGLKNRLEEIWELNVLFIIQKNMLVQQIVLVFMRAEKAIIDFKQSNKPKKTEYIDSWLLQTAAYSLAHNVVYNSNINSCVILFAQ